MYASYDTAFNDDYVEKKNNAYAKQRDEKVKCFKEKYANSQYVLVGTYGFEHMSRMPDNLIYDKINNKYFTVGYGKMLRDNITIEEINKNNKNIDNRNAYYLLFDKKNYIPVLFVNGKYVSVDGLIM